MAQESSVAPQADIYVENVGGITETEVTLSPGVTVLEGENATNRTSFLQGIMAGLGSDTPSLKADAEVGRVELTMGTETYTRQFERTETGVRAGGDPYLEDPTPADSFAFLLESNPARQAVIRQDDLREVIMAPIDTTAIQAEITQKRARKSKLDEELEELESLGNRRPNLTQQVTEIEGKIEAKRETLAEIREEIDGMETDLSETKETRAAMESAFETLQELRTEQSRISDRIESERESLEDAKTERETLQSELESVPESVADRRSELKAQVSTRRSTQSQLESAVSELQNLIQFNEDLLGGEATVLQELREEETAVTERLVEDGSVTCWTCGTAVDQSEIRNTIDRLRELRADKLERISRLEDELEELQGEIESLEERAERRTSLERDLERVEDEIESRSQTIEDLEERETDLEGKIEEKEAEIESLEFAESHDELLSLHQEANRLELEIERLETDRDQVESDLEAIEERLERRSELEADRDAVTEELKALRTKVDRIETEAVEEFNDRMEEILEIMGYSNIARIWIERLADGQENAEFVMHVIRSDATGMAYEDTIDHLSESEREVTGLVFGLAGYLVHEVADTVPFMLLDSVEALDSDRIARLVEYFEAHVPYLVVALLPEDAQALADSYPRVTEI